MENSHPCNLAFHFSDLNKPTDCGTKLPFICEKYNVSSLEKYSPDSAAKIQCSGDWITFQNKVKRELLHCTDDDCFHDGCVACGRIAAHQITSLRQPLRVSVTRLIPQSARNQVNSQVSNAYRSFKELCSYSVLVNLNC